eukprot:gb/GFBE01079739.1/.p1 GENE.gb/GFBE01079739.1/~~gb/GFBE01079739.1/.p1  ORF type:complete len:178 (+),score=32.51 gb/GFBE01079739.1/:1-534(+)
MAPQRSKMLPVLVGACACAALLHGAAFVGFTGASMQAPGEVGRSVNVAMRNKLARKWIKSPEQKNFISAKDKQSKIAKDKQGKADKKKAVGEMEWPVQIPEGVTLLHVEYDQRLRDKPSACVPQARKSGSPRLLPQDPDALWTQGSGHHQSAQSSGGAVASKGFPRRGLRGRQRQHW